MERGISSLGLVIAWGQWMAVVFGTVQNYVFRSLLLGFGSETGVQISYWATLFFILFSNQFVSKRVFYRTVYKKMTRHQVSWVSWLDSI
jgi:hypothetical protein